MKKLLVLCLICLPALLSAEGNKNEVNLKLGITPYSVLNYSTELSLNPDKTRLGDLGLMFTTEYFRKLACLFSLGAGVSQQFDRAMSDNDGSLYFTSLYLAPKINLYKNLYFVGQIGASFINSNQLIWSDTEFDRKKPGMYYGVGAGYGYRNFIFEFLYSINQASYEFDLAAMDSEGNGYYMPLKRKETYQTFNFNIGYKFNF
jgi:hypothetical protein